VNKNTFHRQNLSLFEPILGETIATGAFPLLPTSFDTCELFGSHLVLWSFPKKPTLEVFSLEEIVSCPYLDKRRFMSFKPQKTFLGHTTNLLPKTLPDTMNGNRKKCILPFPRIKKIFEPGTQISHNIYPLILNNQK
jgi:hypothetical protein